MNLFKNVTTTTAIFSPGVYDTLLFYLIICYIDLTIKVTQFKKHDEIEFGNKSAVD